MRGATRIPRGRPLGAGAKLGAALALGLPACGGGDGADGLSVVVDTVGGVEHVTSFGPGTWADEGGGWWLDEGASTEIGAVEGPDEVVFGRISGVLVDPEGRIHVADPQAREVRVFSPDGGFLRRVGRDGEGPGEFRHLSGLALAPDGVAALDGSLGRVTVFDGSGQVVRTFRLERPYMILEHFAAMGFDREGRFLDRARLSLRPGTDSIPSTWHGAVSTESRRSPRTASPSMSSTGPWSLLPSPPRSATRRSRSSRGSSRTREGAFRGASSSRRGNRRSAGWP